MRRRPDSDPTGTQSGIETIRRAAGCDGTCASMRLPQRRAKSARSNGPWPSPGASRSDSRCIRTAQGASGQWAAQAGACHWQWPGLQVRPPRAPGLGRTHEHSAHTGNARTHAARTRTRTHVHTHWQTCTRTRTPSTPPADRVSRARPFPGSRPGADSESIPADEKRGFHPRPLANSEITGNGNRGRVWCPTPTLRLVLQDLLLSMKCQPECRPSSSSLLLLAASHTRARARARTGGAWPEIERAANFGRKVPT